VAQRVPPKQAVAGILALRRALLGLADRIVPPHLAVFDKTIGIARTHLYAAIGEVGLADELAKGKATAQELADRLDLNADAVHRVLRAGAVDGATRMDRRGRFRLTRRGATIAKDHPHSMHDWARYMALGSSSAAWGAVAHTLRTGETAFNAVHGMGVWDWLARHPDEERLFAGGMRRMTEDDAPFIVAGYPWPEEGTICDVAGGAGTLLARILEARPGAQGIVLDAKGVLEAADAHLTEVGVRDRVMLVEGNMFESVTAVADVYLLKNVLHDWGDDACLRILRTVRATMPAGSRLVIVEALQEPNEPHPFASLSDIQMLVQCEGGRERSADELKALLSAAGLRPGKVYETAAPALVEGIA
jgi:O-methyltransferase domain